MLLENKTAIVTGGTRGIGIAIVRKFLDNGANVALCGSCKETVDKAIAKLLKDFSEDRLMGIYPKLIDKESVKSNFNEVKKRFGRIDILVNNAGISARDRIYNYKVEDFTKVIDLNLNSVFICSQAVAKVMKEQGGGVILNTSSMVARYGQPSGVAYPASKAAVNMLTLSLARELGEDNIRVCAVAPGVTNTDMVSSLPKDLIKPIIDQIPLKRIGEPEDVANAFLFLASDMASYITGAILPVDGAARS